MAALEEDAVGGSLPTHHAFAVALLDIVVGILRHRFDDDAVFLKYLGIFGAIEYLICSLVSAGCDASLSFVSFDCSAILHRRYSVHVLGRWLLGRDIFLSKIQFFNCEALI